MSDKKDISKDAILERMQTAIRSFFKCPDAAVTPETVALDIDGWDSLSHTVFMLELENEFAVTFDAAEVLGFTNVGEVVDAVFSHLLHGSIDHDALHVPKIDKPPAHTDLDFLYPIFEFKTRHEFKMQAGEGFWEELEKSGFLPSDDKDGKGVSLSGQGGSLTVPCRCNPKDTLTFYIRLAEETPNGLEVSVNDKPCPGEFKDDEKILFGFSFTARDYLSPDAIEGENTFRVSLNSTGEDATIVLTEAMIELDRWSDGVKINNGTEVLWGEALWRDLDRVGGRPFLSEYNSLIHRNEDGSERAGDIHVLGDSHALYNFCVYSEIRAHFVAPISVFRLIKGTIDLDAHKIGPGQNVLFNFGEIDCRIIVASLADRIAPEELIDHLGEKYLETLNRICAPKDIKAGVVLAVPPYPLNVNSDPLFPVVGALGERVEYTKLFNVKLRSLKGRGCVSGVIDAYTPFVTEDGVMDKYFAADETHLRPDRTDPLFAQVMTWASTE